MELGKAIDESTTYRAARRGNDGTLWVVDSPPGEPLRIFYGGDPQPKSRFLIDGLGTFDDWAPLDPILLQSVCPDCRGSGKYVGLQRVELCRLCVGRGHVAAELATG